MVGFGLLAAAITGCGSSGSEGSSNAFESRPVDDNGLQCADGPDAKWQQSALDYAPGPASEPLTMSAAVDAYLDDSMPGLPVRMGGSTSDGDLSIQAEPGADTSVVLTDRGAVVARVNLSENDGAWVVTGSAACSEAMELGAGVSSDVENSFENTGEVSGG